MGINMEDTALPGYPSDAVIQQRPFIVYFARGTRRRDGTAGENVGRRMRSHEHMCLITRRFKNGNNSIIKEFDNIFISLL